METFNKSGSGNESLRGSVELKSDVNLRKVCDVSVKVNAQPESQTSPQTLFRTEEKTFESEQSDDWKKMIVSYMVNENERLKYLQKCQKFDSPEKILSENHFENKSESRDKEIYHGLRSLSSNEEDSRDQNRHSKVRSNEEINPEQMIEIIQRELKTLEEMSPSVTTLATALSETLSHYKECFRCSKKISSSLPRILNRIQKLIEYVTAKRHGTYLWPNDSSYLRLATSGSTFKEPEKIINSVSYEPKSDLLSKKSRKKIEQSEKVNVADVAEGRPGIQIALRFISEIKRKRVFDQAEPRFSKDFCASFPLVNPKESYSVPIIEILKPGPEPNIFWDKRNTIISPKELFYAYRLVFALPSIILISILVITPQFRINKIEIPQRTQRFKSIQSYEERDLQSKKNLCTVFVPQAKKGSKSKSVRSGCGKAKYPNEKKSFAEKLIANAPEMVQDLLKEAEEENMRIQMMKELELEVKELKDLILEIHKNQIELGKIVVEEGIYSHPIVKLADPDILEEESQIMKKLAEYEGLGRKSSVENLQTTIDNLKQKCTLKNRMIMTLVKSLRGNMYKKWWGEIIGSAFEESESVEEISLEKLTELLQQTSLFLVEGKKESKESLQESRNEEQNSEEEPNVKEIKGTNFPKILSHQDKKLVKAKGCKPLTSSGSNNSENMSSVRKLESQISLLSIENERLWHEIHELRDLLKDSMKRLPSSESGQQSPGKIKTSGKTINLTIQITPEKDFRRLNDGPCLKIIKNDETAGFSGVSKTSPGVQYTVAEFVTDENEIDFDKSSQDHNPSDLSTDSKFRSKSERRRSENDLIYVSPPTFSSDCGRENENLKALLREKDSVKEQNALGMSPPHSSCQDFRQNPKPVLCFPSKHVVPEMIGCHQAGPSRRPVEFRRLPQRSSRTELTENQSLGAFAMMANERELQTIPEHDHNNSGRSSNFSKDVSQAIQCLRARVRSVHKDVTVLKSKNDRIDKMIDRLIDDAVDSNKNLDEFGNELNNFKNRLG